MTLAATQNPRRMQRIALPDGEVYYRPRAPLGHAPGALMKILQDEIAWRAESIVVFGKKMMQPRLIAWYGDPGRVYTYSGLRLAPLPWTETLSAVRRHVSRACGAKFDSVLLNLYRDQRDSMGMHSDDEPELGPCPVIASVSLGEERTFVMQHRRRTDVAPLRLRLASGSLLLMKGATQHHWKHGVPKQTRPCGPRINLTFRRIV